jgi:hypothetical protein
MKLNLGNRQYYLFEGILFHRRYITDVHGALITGIHCVVCIVPETVSAEYRCRYHLLRSAGCLRLEQHRCKKRGKYRSF